MQYYPSLQKQDLFAIDNFTKELLELHIKYGHGNLMLYDVGLYSYLGRTTATLTVQEFYDRAYLINPISYQINWVHQDNSLKEITSSKQ